MHAGSAGVPTVEEYLTAHFAAGQTLLLDGSCVPATIANGYAAALAKSGAKLESKDIVSPPVGEPRPPAPACQHPLRAADSLSRPAPPPPSALPWCVTS